MELFDSETTLFTYIGALAIFCLSLLLLLLYNVSTPRNQRVHLEPLIDALTAATAFLLLIFKPQQNFDLDLIASIVLFAIVLVVLALVLRERWRSDGQWKVGATIVIFVFANTLLFWNYIDNNISGVRITALLHKKPYDEQTLDENLSSTWEEAVAKEFQDKYKAEVTLKPAPSDVEERLKVIQLACLPSDDPKKARNNEIDVLSIDVIWTKVLSYCAEDLSSDFGSLKGFFKPAVDNNTIFDNKGKSKLVAVPWFIDVGLLFYRPKLLKQYTNSEEPPQTWDDLEKMAKLIQDGERSDKNGKKGNKDFWGFIWQGKPYEALTCNALEWQHSHNGGFLVNNKGDFDINPSAVNAFEQARDWVLINKISPPPEVIKDYDEAKTIKMWMEGNAAFMRHWAYAYLASSDEKNSIVAKDDDIGVALLPFGNNGRSVSMLGGWQLMSNTYSNYKKKKAAIKFIKFLTNRERQESIAKNTGRLPVLEELYEDADVWKTLPYIDSDRLKPLFSNLLNNKIVVRRPSKVLGEEYPKVSEIYSNKIQDILQNRDKSKTTQMAIEAMEYEIGNVLNSRSSIMSKKLG